MASDNVPSLDSLKDVISDIAQSSTPSIQKYKLGDIKLQSGDTLRDAEIAYKIHGSKELPVIVYPTWFSGDIAGNEWLIGPSHTLNPEKYCIIIVALFGNGESTSPSNSTQRPFPDISVYDNVQAQHKLLSQHLGITHAKAVLGWSMGAAQTFQWATQYPTFMDYAIPFCGAAKCALHNQVFLEGIKSILLLAKGQQSAGPGNGAKVNGVKVTNELRDWTENEKDNALRAFGRAYAGWGLSQHFFREKVYTSAMGFDTLEDFLVGYWEDYWTSKDPENLLTMLHTWQTADVSNQSPYNGDFSAALKAIKAKTLILPSKTDLYFPPEDSEAELALLTPGVGELKVFPSIWGHWAGGPGYSKEDVKWLDAQLKALGL